MANALTGLRIAFSALILFTLPFSPQFYVLYILAGISDILDGFVARKLHCVSKFGATFDGVADMFFIFAVLIKLLPALHIPLWLYVFVLIIAFIKVANIIYGYHLYKRMVFEHTAMNKALGALLFVFPLLAGTLPFMSTAFCLSLFAFISAIHEWHCIKKGIIIS